MVQKKTNGPAKMTFKVLLISSRRSIIQLNGIYSNIDIAFR